MAKPSWMPDTDWLLVTTWAALQAPEDSGLADTLSTLTAAIGKHETQWGQLGAGRQGYYLGVGVPSKGPVQTQYAGLENQLEWAMPRLRAWFGSGLVSFDRLLQFAQNVWKPDDPETWARGVYAIYQGASKDMAQPVNSKSTGLVAFWNNPGRWIRDNIFTDQVIIFLVAILLLILGLWGMMKQ